MSNDKELSDLTEITSLDGTEILYVVDDPAGTQADRKVTVTNLLGAGSGTYVSAGYEAPTHKMPAEVSSTIVTSFQSGHGWVSNGSGSYSLNDTTGMAAGMAQAVKMTSAGNGSNTQVKKTGLTSIDLTGKTLALTVKVDDNTHLKQLYLQAGDSALANRFVLGLQGTVSQDDEYIESGKWVRLVVPWSPVSTVGTPTRSAVTDFQVQAVDDNTGNAVVVRLQQLEIVPEPVAEWPHGVVSFSFDDGYSSQYTAALPKLAAYRFPATAYAICDIIDTNGFLTTAQLREMQDVHDWTIAAHSYAKTVHDNRYPTYTSAEQIADMALNRKWLIDRGFKGKDLFAYPGGKFGNGAIDNARRLYSAARTVKNRQYETWPPSDPHKIRAISVQSTTTLAELTAAVDDAYTNKYWLIIIFHRLLSSAGSGNDWLISDFNTLVDYVATKGIPVRTESDVLDHGTNQTASELLTSVKTVDGPGSGLDADTVDGVEAAALATLASPAFTGNPTAPTQSAGNNSTRLATTAYADTGDAAVTAAAAADATTKANAKVADAINDGTTTVAPSQNAVFDALALKTTSSILRSHEHNTASARHLLHPDDAQAAITLVSGTGFFTYFTLLEDITISQLSYATSATLSSGTTLARFALYTAAANGDLTIVARTASDTGLYASGFTVYTRSLSTTGGYPASYTLLAGTRYATGQLWVGSGAGNIRGASIVAGIGSYGEIRAMTKTGLSDLDANIASLTASGSIAWAGVKV